MAPTYQYRWTPLGGSTLLGRLGLVAGIALALAAAIVLLVLSVSLAIVLVPAVALALAIIRWRLAKAGRAAGVRPSTPRVIETDYVVIDRTRDPR